MPIPTSSKVMLPVTRIVLVSLLCVRQIAHVTKTAPMDVKEVRLTQPFRFHA